jgi:AraC family transcriptional regulator, regulatory protein of adaptative response / DNA-3-methyladenine glycosylase II
VRDSIGRRIVRPAVEVTASYEAPADGVDLNRDACYRAIQTRDARFDGRFYTAVVTTGIYCRPICPARPPKIENCIFLPSAAAAHQMGFRPCLRCRPEVAPGVAGWRGTANTVSRALHLIVEGALDDASVDDLAERLGVGSRHLRRLFDRYLGATPISVAQAHRILFAKKLIGETRLSMTQIALAAGFGSIRRFNDTFHKTYARTPSMLRTRSRVVADDAVGVTLKLPFTGPYDWPAMIGFLAARAIPGVERVQDSRYCRTFALDSARGCIEVRPIPGESHLLVTIRTSNVAALATIVGRVRRLFDLDADIVTIDAHLARDPLLARKVRERPGIRVPGAWDNFELAVRAVLGQQVTVSAATTFAGRLATAYGTELAAADEIIPAGPTRIFPTPAAMAQADLTSVGLTRARAATSQGLSKAMTADSSLLRAYETLDETVEKLSRLPGIGPWTAQYIAMRALREPDAFPASDLGLLRAMQTSRGRPTPAKLTATANAWRPWRAYAALRLWTQGGPRSRD